MSHRFTLTLIFMMALEYLRRLDVSIERLIVLVSEGELDFSSDAFFVAPLPNRIARILII